MALEPKHEDELRWTASSRLQTSARRAVTNRRVFPYLALVTLAMAFLAGFLETIVDRTDFPTYGAAVWWAIVTLATVGYGDIVPTTPLGRLVASAVIVFGVTFISFLTATVTSVFVSSAQEEQAAEDRKLRAASEEKTRALLQRIDERLAAIEGKPER